MSLLSVPPERAARESTRSAADTTAARDWSRRLLRLFLAWVGWFTLGTAIVLASFAMTAGDLARVVFWFGLCVGWIGALLSVMFFAVAGTERGEL